MDTARNSACQRYRARWLFPGLRAPLENATIDVEQGRIVAIAPQSDAPARNLGNVAVIPGLVNAHAHLEFSNLPAPIEPRLPFTAWLTALIAHRRANPAERATAIDRGSCECVQAGTTVVGEIATAGWQPALVPQPGLQVVAFHEALGLSPDRKPEQLRLARAHVERAAAKDTAAFVWGLSPHAPYTVHPELFHGLVDLAAEYAAPLAMHLAETQSELELLDQGTGEFVAFLRDLGVWQPNAIDRGSRPLDYLAGLARLPRVLVIHANYLADDEINYLAGRENFSVVYCPRTHAGFGHTPHRWREMQDRGVRVALGTDGRGSNPDLSLWNELLFLRRQFPQVEPSRLLRMGTLAGAEALGLARDTGDLTPGKSADLAVVGLPDSGGRDPYTLLFASENRIVATMRAGRWLAGPPCEPAAGVQP